MSLDAALVGARLLHEAALLVFFGIAAFPLYAAPGLARERPAFADWRRRRLLAASSVALVAGALWLAFTTAGMSGEARDAADPAAIGAVIAETDFGRLWAARLAGGLALAVLAGLRAPAGWQCAVAAPVLASLAATGHGGEPEGLLGQAHMAADAVHLLAAGLWIGALWALGWLVVRLPDAPVTEQALRRFSGAGQLAVALLILTGGVNAYAILGQPAKLLTTTYGRWLSVKLAAFAGMIVLAALNRFVLVPRMAAGGGVGRLRLQIFGEQVLSLIVVTIVAIIGALDPGS